MKPVVKNQVALFTPQGFIDGNNAPLVFEQNDVNYALRAGAKALVVSLEKAVMFNKNGYGFLEEAMETMVRKHGVETGFCDYAPRVYDQIMAFCGQSPKVNLYQSSKVMDLFLGTRKREGKVLVWNRNATLKNNLIVRLRAKGYAPEVVRTDEEYYEKLDKGGYDLVVDRTIVAMEGLTVAHHTKGNAVVYALSGYLDGSLAEHFDIGYHRNSLTVGFKLFVFESSEVKAINTHAVNFLSRLAVEGAEYGAIICIAGLDMTKISANFKESLTDMGVVFEESFDSVFKNESLMREAASGGGGVRKTRKTLTKELIRHLPHFVDAAVGTVEAMTGIKAEKGKVAIEDFAVDLTEELLATSIGFYGDLDGMAILVFPARIAKKTCKLLLGEEEVKDDQVLDALSEFVNIIAGQAKNSLQKRNVSIQITLPRTFADLDAVQEVVEHRKGVQVNMRFDGEPFYLFLTR